MNRPFSRGHKILIWSIIIPAALVVIGWFVAGKPNVTTIAGSVSVNGDNNLIILPQNSPINSPGLHLSNATFKSSHPEIYGPYPYIVVGGDAHLNVTSSSSTYYGKNTVLNVQGSSTVNFSSVNDQFGK